MCDEVLVEDGKRRTYFYLNNSREEMAGRSFLKRMRFHGLHGYLYIVEIS